MGINIDLTSATELTHTLTVNGDVKATNYLATAGGYADYVFQDYFTGNSEINGDYEFIDLEDAITFVKENGHLPNVKSYAEIKAANMQIDLGATSMKNLEKIEENFLYIAEMKRENDALKEENIKIKNQMQSILKRLEKLEQLED